MSLIELIHANPFLLFFLACLLAVTVVEVVKAVVQGKLRP